MTAEWNKQKQGPEVQRLALSGYDFEASLHLVLKIGDAAKARAFLSGLLRHKDRHLAFGDRPRNERKPAINVGFTYRGLEALHLPERYLAELRNKAPEFCEGARARAASRLGDAGPGAVEHWEPMFGQYRAHVLISIHGENEREVDEIARQLASPPDARRAFSGWDDWRLCAHHLPDSTGKKIRTVHFGFRDNIAMPKICEEDFAPAKLRHRAGELLLGYPNDLGFNYWGDNRTAKDVAQFFRNGSFAALRKIEQHEDRFNKFLADSISRLGIADTQEAQDYLKTKLKAKLCGRWPTGKRILPPGATDESEDFDFSDDAEGIGCPFGAHIRRTNPRGDEIAPARLRPLFRRGMPYGPKFNEQTKDKKRGLIGLFFCASLEDQFEDVMSEWVEKKPMGPPNFGNAKDPLVGRHDGTSVFHIPQPDGSVIALTIPEPFVTTRGTLYAFFPSRSALSEIGGVDPQESGVEETQGPMPHAVPPLRAATEPGDILAEFTYERTPPDRFCDVVMEGGVTSGIIYASAVANLAKAYRLKSIGGSSIGGFAAALAAAAEYRRRNGQYDGFVQMGDLPDKLAEEDGTDKTLLLRLFNPQAGTKRLFETFLAVLGDKSTVARIGSILIEAIRQYLLPVVLAVIAAAVLMLAGPLALILRNVDSAQAWHAGANLAGVVSWGFALLIALTAAVGGALLLCVVVDLIFGLVPNGFGFCRGWSKDRAFDPDDLDLAGFLHGSIQTLAGRNPLVDPPLTFEDLWNAPGGPAQALGFKGTSYSERSINLEVYSANLAHGRPYRFPLDPRDDMGRLFFRAEDLEQYFPKQVMKHLLAYSVPYTPRSASDPAKSADTASFLELPEKKLPIVVAARLAMSFPFLISAVPLWAIDYEPHRKQRNLKRCWMSDGSLCSNFPIHLFDSFMPKWPTFGISLQTRSNYRNESIWLPDRHYQGRADTWDRFDESKSALGRLIGFVVSLWMAAWRWNDTTMMRMPGVRDRVVRVLLKEGEGGLNINMPGTAIKNLSENYGKPAAAAFLKKFAIDDSPGWPEHRWVRFNRLLIALRDQIEGVTFAANLGRYTTPMKKQIASSARNPPPLRGPSRGNPAPSEKHLTCKQVVELQLLLGALSQLESTFAKAGNHKPYIAVPRPSLRVRHPT